MISQIDLLIHEDLGKIAQDIPLSGPALIGPDPQYFENGMVTFYVFFYEDWSIPSKALYDLVVTIWRWMWLGVREVPLASLGSLDSRGGFVAKAAFRLELHLGRDQA